MSSGIGWQIPRLPGLGDADWGEIFSNLYRVGYDGDCIIEHEDRRFEGTDQLVKRGFCSPATSCGRTSPRANDGDDRRPPSSTG